MKKKTPRRSAFFIPLKPDLDNPNEPSVQMEKKTLRRSAFFIPLKPDLHNPNEPSAQMEKRSDRFHFFLSPSSNQNFVLDVLENKKSDLFSQITFPLGRDDSPIIRVSSP